MISIKNAWNSFWFTEGPPHALAAFRILFSLFWLVIWLSWLPHVSLYFSGNGMYFPAYPSPAKNITGFQTFIGWLTRSPSLLQAWLLYSTGLGLLLLVAIGFLTRLALIAFFFILNYHYYLYLHMHGTSFD